MFLCSDKDRVEVCFSGEFDCEEFSKQNAVDFYCEGREVSVYYISESEEGKEIVSRLVKEVDVKLLSSVKSGYYLVVDDKNREGINKKLRILQENIKGEK